MKRLLEASKASPVAFETPAELGTYVSNVWPPAVETAITQHATPKKSPPNECLMAYGTNVYTYVDFSKIPLYLQDYCYGGALFHSSRLQAD
jgi:hypothetical protein